MLNIRFSTIACRIGFLPLIFTIVSITAFFRLRAVTSYLKNYLFQEFLSLHTERFLSLELKTCYHNQN